MKVRKLSIALKLAVIVAALLIVTDLVLGIVMYNKASASLTEQIGSNALNMANSISARLEKSGYTDALATFKPGDEGTEEYKILQDELTVFFENSGCEYVYTIRAAGNGGYEFVVDSDPEAPASIGDTLEGEDAITAALNGTPSLGEPYADEWGNHLTAYSPIHGSTGNIVGLTGTDISMDWINGQLAGIRSTVIVVCLIVFGAGMLVVVILMLRLRKQFVTLNDKVIELGNGNGDLTRTLDINSGDEMEEIAENVNRFIAFIHDVVSNTTRNSQVLTKASNSMRSSISDTSQQVTDISSTMEEMSAMTQEMSSALVKITGSLDEALESIEGIARISAGNTEESEKIIAEAERIYDFALRSREEVKDKSGRMNESLNHKIEESEKVSKITELTDNIIAIAGQTNLLALNASIEAARAGEAGRGFAVVAEEIKSLADNSNNVANQIKDIGEEVTSIVEELASESKGMLEYMSETTDRGYSELLKTSENYRNDIRSLIDMMLQLRDESEHIREEMEYINEAVRNIDTSVEESAQGITQSAEAVSSIAMNMTSLNDDAANNLEITENINSDMGKFKV